MNFSLGIAIDGVMEMQMRHWIRPSSFEYEVSLTPDAFSQLTNDPDFKVFSEPPQPEGGFEGRLPFSMFAIHFVDSKDGTVTIAGRPGERLAWRNGKWETCGPTA